MKELIVKARGESIRGAKMAFPNVRLPYGSLGAPVDLHNGVFCTIATPTGRISKFWAAYTYRETVDRSKIENWLKYSVFPFFEKRSREGYGIAEIVQLDSKGDFEGQTFLIPKRFIKELKP